MVSLKIKKESVVEKSPVLKKGEFKVNFPGAIAALEAALHKFSVKRILYDKLFRGRGLEFDSYRQFESFDDADMIDWRATLRANEFLAKKYIQERDLHVYFLVDVSNSMLFGSGDKLKSEYVAEMVCALSHLIFTSGDRIGLVMFNGDIIKVLHPSNSKNQFSLFMKYLSDSSLYGGSFDLNKAIEHVLGLVKFPYTVFFVVSDFIKVRKDSERSLRLMGSKFETVAVVVRDPMDEKLPKTGHQLSLQDPYSGRQMVMDPSISADRYEKLAMRQKAGLKDVFKKSQIDCLELMTDKSFAYPTSTFLKVRASKGGRI